MLEALMHKDCITPQWHAACLLACMRRKLLQQQLAFYAELFGQNSHTFSRLPPHCPEGLMHTHCIATERLKGWTDCIQWKMRCASHMATWQSQCRPHQDVGDHLQRSSCTAFTPGCRLATPLQRMLVWAVCQEHAQMIQPVLDILAC